MREFKRKDRLQDQITREVADIVQNILRDPNLGMITITGTELTKDLRFAKIFFSVLGEEDVVKASRRVLGKSAKRIQSELARRLHVRSVPLISFHVDNSAEYGQHMEELFKQIKAERKQKENGSDEKRTD